MKMYRSSIFNIIHCKQPKWYQYGAFSSTLVKFQSLKIRCTQYPHKSYSTWRKFKILSEHRASSADKQNSLGLAVNIDISLKRAELCTVLMWGFLCPITQVFSLENFRQIHIQYSSAIKLECSLSIMNLCAHVEVDIAYNTDRSPICTTYKLKKASFTTINYSSKSSLLLFP